MYEIPKKSFVILCALCGYLRLQSKYVPINFIHRKIWYLFRENKFSYIHSLDSTDGTMPYCIYTFITNLVTLEQNSSRSSFLNEGVKRGIQELQHPWRGNTLFGHPKPFVGIQKNGEQMVHLVIHILHTIYQGFLSEL